MLLRKFRKGETIHFPKIEFKTIKTEQPAIYANIPSDDKHAEYANIPFDEKLEGDENISNQTTTYANIPTLPEEYQTITQSHSPSEKDQPNQ